METVNLKDVSCRLIGKYHECLKDLIDAKRYNSETFNETVIECEIKYYLMKGILINILKIPESELEEEYNRHMCLYQ